MNLTDEQIKNGIVCEREGCSNPALQLLGGTWLCGPCSYEAIEKVRKNNEGVRAQVLNMLGKKE